MDSLGDHGTSFVLSSLPWYSTPSTSLAPSWTVPESWVRNPWGRYSGTPNVGSSSSLGGPGVPVSGPGPRGTSGNRVGEGHSSRRTDRRKRCLDDEWVFPGARDHCSSNTEVQEPPGLCLGEDVVGTPVPPRRPVGRITRLLLDPRRTRMTPDPPVAHWDRWDTDPVRRTVGPVWLDVERTLEVGPDPTPTDPDPDRTRHRRLVTVEPGAPVLEWEVDPWTGDPVGTRTSRLEWGRGTGVVGGRWVSTVSGVDRGGGLTPGSDPSAHLPACDRGLLLPPPPTLAVVGRYPCGSAGVSVPISVPAGRPRLHTLERAPTRFRPGPPGRPSDGWSVGSRFDNGTDWDYRLFRHPSLPVSGEDPPLPVTRHPLAHNLTSRRPPRETTGP